MQSTQSDRAGRIRAHAASLLVLLIFVAGCSRFRPKVLTSESVYVTAKQTFLRDRIAAVSNRTGIVNNGDKLTVLEHGRRFLRVKTSKGEIGWIDEKAVATQQVADTFIKLDADHAKEPSIASAVVRDEVYLHIKPGRETERFYRLVEGDKLQLIARATLPKALPPGQAPPKPPPAKPGQPEPAPLPPVMEDWWLVRDAQKHAGWIYSRMIDVDAPDTLTRYAEGQRFVGAYILTTVNDPEAPMENKDVPIYLTVLSPYRAGLPYDYDQVRLFTWSTKMHRYETGFREKNIEGYLPVKIGKMKDPNGKSAMAQTELPSFTYRILAGDSAPAVPDPVTGIVTPQKLIFKTYRLEGNTVHRILDPGQDPKQDQAHPEPPPEKGKKGKKKK
jgi:SH3-like domain-containing protein